MSGMSDHEYRRSWLSHIENGMRDLPRDHAIVMARALGVTPNDIYGLTGAPEPSRLNALVNRYGDDLSDDDLDLVESLLARLTAADAERHDSVA